VSTAEEAPQRSGVERQVGVGLITLLVLSALVVVYGVVYLVTSWNGEDRTRFDSLRIAVVFLVLPGVVVFFSASSARRRLRAQVVSARLYSILSGAFGILAGIPLVTVILGPLILVAGLFTLIAALLLKKPVPHEAAP
jgi:cytochrome bd-type quinol oxidase subunit 2